MESLLQDRDHQVDTDGNPDLRLHCVGRSTVECFDPEVLFDPLEEQFDLPAATEQLGDHQCRKVEMVGQEDQAFVGLGIAVANTAQQVGIAFCRIVRNEPDTLVALQALCLVDLVRVQSAKAEVFPRAGDKEGAR